MRSSVISGNRVKLVVLEQNNKLVKVKKSVSLSETERKLVTILEIDKRTLDELHQEQFFFLKLTYC